MVDATQIEKMGQIVTAYAEWDVQQKNVTQMAQMPMDGIKQVIATYYNGNTTISIAFEGSDEVFGVSFKGGSVIPQAVAFAIEQIQTNLDAKKAEIDALYDTLA